jgi:hypothetical protein
VKLSTIKSEIMETEEDEETIKIKVNGDMRE